MRATRATLKLCWQDWNAAVGYDDFPFDPSVGQEGYHGGYHMPHQACNGFMEQALSLGSEGVFNMGLQLFQTHPHRFPHQLCKACKNPECSEKSFPHLLVNAQICSMFEESELSEEDRAEIADEDWDTITYVNDNGNKETVRFVYRGLSTFPQQHRYYVGDHRMMKNKLYRDTNSNSKELTKDSIVGVRKIQAVLKAGILDYKAPKSKK